MKTILNIILAALIIIASCNQSGEPDNNATKSEFYLGADLSYVNEMGDCGGIYRENGVEVDPYELFSRKGCELVRLRLWHTPDWSGYSDFEDVKKSINRAREQGMQALLDFHYSDTWADPQKQIIPKAWKNINDLNILGDSVYNYTYNTLQRLADVDLFPEFVQVGNEINIEILQQENQMVIDSINWDRNIFLLNKGIRAVKDVAKENGLPVGIMLHIAQPENADWWFTEAFENGVEDFDWIGLSYYPKWSSLRIHQVPGAIRSIKDKFGKKIMIVEVAYPHTLENADDANNILGEDALHKGYAATPEGQLKFLTDLTELTAETGCKGVIYWEPAWITNNCSTPWGNGSHWDNATFFDAQNGNEALNSFDFFKIR